MSLTQFPHGISSFGIPQLGGGNLIPQTTGTYFFVDDSGSTSYDGLDSDHPFPGLNYAISQCTADVGDVILLMPGHAENIASAGAIVASVSGITVVGLGNGPTMPKLSFTSTANATFDITAANTRWINVNWEANVADVAIGIDISAVDAISFEGCKFTEAGTDLNYVIFMDLATGSSNLTINNCQFIGGDASNDNMINMVAHDGLYIYDSYFAANTAQATVVALINATGNVTNTDIKNCSFRSNKDGALFIISDQAANSGCISWCGFSSVDTAGAVTAGINWTGAHVFECYVAGDADSFGLVGGGTVYGN